MSTFNSKNMSKSGENESTFVRIRPFHLCSMAVPHSFSAPPKKKLRQLWAQRCPFGPTLPPRLRGFAPASPGQRPPTRPHLSRPTRLAQIKASHHPKGFISVTGSGGILQWDGMDIVAQTFRGCDAIWPRFRRVWVTQDGGGGVTPSGEEEGASKGQIGGDKGRESGEKWGFTVHSASWIMLWRRENDGCFLDGFSSVSIAAGRVDEENIGRVGIVDGRDDHVSQKWGGEDLRRVFFVSLSQMGLEFE